MDKTDLDRADHESILGGDRRPLDLGDRMRRGIIEALAYRVEPNATHGHSHKVADLAADIASRVADVDPELARRAGLLHDIGKMLLPFDPGSLPRRLTTSEMKMVKEHSLLGARIALWAGEHEEVVESVLYHHERLDGTGYPFGLRGAAVPLLSQVVAAADVYDALTRARAYKSAWGPEHVDRYFAAHRGSKFHSRVLDALHATIGDWTATSRRTVSPEPGR